MSIAEAIENAQEKVKAVYTKCSEKGATLPEVQNLTNLPATIDTVKSGGGDVVKAYVSGVNLWTPSWDEDGIVVNKSISEKEVLLTKIGYQAVGSETLSPEVRVSLLSEEGFAMKVDTYNETVKLYTSTKYNIVDGSVDVDSGVQRWDSSDNVEFYNQVLPFFFNGGKVLVEAARNNSYSGFYHAQNFVFYSYNNYGKLNLHTTNRPITLLDCGSVCGGWKTLTLINDDGSIEAYDLTQYCPGMMSGSSEISPPFVFAEDRQTFWAYYPTSYNWIDFKLVKLEKGGTGFTATEIRADPTVTNYPTLGEYTILVQTKGRVPFIGGYYLYLLHQNGYVQLKVYIRIGSEEITGVEVEFLDYPEYIISNIGDRTINKIQTFYDGTFSFDLSDGTTLIMGFGGLGGTPYVVETIEPFVVEGDDTIYHRTFTANKLFWYQRPEPATYNSRHPLANAPIESNPYGSYNATKATVDWLTVPRTESRWNNTVLTGVVRADAQAAKPEFDETNRRVINVETAITKGSVPIENVTVDWTKEDLDKVNSLG